MDRYFILDSGLSFAFSLYNMSTLDERRAHKQEAGVKVHCYSLQMADRIVGVTGGRFFVMGQIYTSFKGCQSQMSLLTQNHMPQVN